MTTHPITRPTFAEQKRQSRQRAEASRPPPGPLAVHHWRCQRCNRLFWTRGIQTECHRCIDHAIRAFGLGPIQGQVSGS